MSYKNKKDQKVAARRNYLRNTELMKKRAGIHRDFAVLRDRQYVYDYLLNHPCSCGESDPAVLQFDHRDGSDKVKEISAASRNGWSIDRLQKEIDKCDVLCANCHSRRTAKQFGWYSKLKTI